MTVVVVVVVMESGVRSASGVSSSEQYGLQGSLVQIDGPKLPLLEPPPLELLLPELLPLELPPLELPDPLSAPASAAVHTPAVHVCPDAHFKPHTPQFEVSVRVLTHVLLQLSKPLAQHLLSLHWEVPPQTTPQAPQLLASDEVSEQPPLQQELPLAHTRPHAPQLFLSVFVLTQRPLQEVSPEPHPVHTPRKHD